MIRSIIVMSLTIKYTLNPNKLQIQFIVNQYQEERNPHHL